MKDVSTEQTSGNQTLFLIDGKENFAVNHLLFTEHTSENETFFEVNKILFWLRTDATNTRSENNSAPDFYISMVFTIRYVILKIYYTIRK